MVSFRLSVTTDYQGAVIKNSVHIVMSTDSLALPRPWNQKNLDDQPGAFFKVEDTYPQIVRRHLRDAMPDREVMVNAYAARGSTMPRPAGIVNDIFNWHKPDAVVIHHGVVDCWERANGKPTVALEDFDAALSKIVDAHTDMSPDIPLILFAILPTNMRMLQKFPNQNVIIEQYNELFRKHRDRHNVFVVDLAEDDLLLATDVVHDDGHHLSRFGHTYYAKRILEILSGPLGIARPYDEIGFFPGEMAQSYEAAAGVVSAKDADASREIIAEFDEQFGDTAAGRYAVGRLYNMMGDSERAFRSLVLLDNEDGETLQATSLLAITAFAALDARDALPFLEKAYVVDPTSSSIVYRLGRSLERVKRFRNALRIYDAFLANHSDDMVAASRDQLERRLNPQAA